MLKAFVMLLPAKVLFLMYLSHVPLVLLSSFLRCGGWHDAATAKKRQVGFRGSSHGAVQHLRVRVLVGEDGKGEKKQIFQEVVVRKYGKKCTKHMIKNSKISLSGC